MHDYRYIWPDGRRTPIAELPDEIIADLLGGPIIIDDPIHQGENETAVKKRLELEQFIRAKGLR